PYEEWSVRNEEFFSKLPERVAAAVPAGSRSPLDSSLLPAFWEEVRLQSSWTTNVPERIAAARRAFEQRWGCHNLEVPVHRLAHLPAFSHFAASLLANLSRFHPAFNEAVRGYRRKYRLRSKHHPFPELGHEGDWLEAPFWVWRSGEVHRQRL